MSTNFHDFFRLSQDFDFSRFFSVQNLLELETEVIFDDIDQSTDNLELIATWAKNVAFFLSGHHPLGFSNISSIKSLILSLIFTSKCLSV